MHFIIYNSQLRGEKNEYKVFNTSHDGRFDIVSTIYFIWVFFRGGEPSAKAEAAQNSARSAQATANDALAKADAAQTAQKQTAKNNRN